MRKTYNEKKRPGRPLFLTISGDDLMQVRQG